MEDQSFWTHSQANTPCLLVDSDCNHDIVILMNSTSIEPPKDSVHFDGYSAFILGVRSNFRGRDLEQQLNTFGIPYEVIWGLEPENDLQEIEKYRNNDLQLFTVHRLLSAREMACSLGHKSIYERFLKMKIEWAVVLEDDSHLIQSPCRVLDHLQTMNAAVLINLHDSKSIRLVRPRKSRLQRQLNNKTDPSIKVRGLAEVLSGNYGYVINRRAAHELLKLMLKGSVGIADWPYGTSSKVKIFDVLPPMVTPGKESTNSLIGERLTPKEKWKERIPRPLRIIRGEELGINIQVLLHQELVKKIGKIAVHISNKMLHTTKDFLAKLGRER